MARFAPIASPHVLEHLGDYLGDYHLLLAHHVLRHKEAYRRLFQEVITPEQRSTMTIIMDNGAYEAGVAVSAETVLEACNVVEPTIVVLSDVIGKAEATLRRTVDDAIFWNKHFPEMPVMAVIQGNSTDEIVQSADMCKRLVDPDYWALPRHFTDRGNSRASVIDDLLSVLVKTSHYFRKPEPYIHLMGISNNILDDMCALRHSVVMGIDSTTPIRLGLERIHMRIAEEDTWPARSDDYLDLVPTPNMLPLPDEVFSNLEVMGALLSNGMPSSK